MTETKLAQIKKNLKHYTPEIIVGCSLIAGAAAIAYIAKSIQTTEIPVMQLDLTKTAVNRMIETGGRMLFESDQLHLIVNITDN